MLKLFFAGCLLVLTGSLYANARPVVDTNILVGTIDFHCHTGPDVTARSVSDIQLARAAKQAGMRAIVLKNHYTMTADRAQVAMQEVGGIEVFGGITLNRSVGGLNAEAVLRMAQMEGGRGRVVWLPTIDAENNFEHPPGQVRKFIPVVKNGKPVPELAEVFQVIAKNNLILETGHSTPEESLILIPAAKQAGITKIIVTHAMLLGATTAQLKQMAAMGAVIECCWQGYLARPGIRDASNQSALKECANVIKSIGAEHFIIDSDLGQKNNPIHPVGMRMFMQALKANGLTDHEIDLVARKNPAMLLGLD